MLVETNWTRSSSSKTAATKPNSISSDSLISIVRVHTSTMAVNANSSRGGGLRGGWKHDQSLGMHFDLDVGSKDEHILSRFGFCDEDEDLEPGKLEILKSDVMRFTRPVNMFHARLQRDVASMKRRIVEEEGDMDVVVLATHLSSVGYKVSLRSALGGGRDSGMFVNLRNEFLIVEREIFGTFDDEYGNVVKIPQGTEEYIVEVRFKEHFAIPLLNESVRYRFLSQVVPEHIVATVSTLKPLVEMLCYEISLSFDACGLTLPPWRRHKSLLSKWLPLKSQDVDMSSPPGGSPRGRRSPVNGSSPNGVVVEDLMERKSPQAWIPEHAACGKEKDGVDTRPKHSLLSKKLSSGEVRFEKHTGFKCASPRNYSQDKEQSTKDQTDVKGPPPKDMPEMKFRTVRLKGVA